jgi:glycosyltransferase involved in cell wall biosynthesis
MKRAEGQLPVSVCIPVRNEALNLPGCLASLKEFDDIVVVDSGSTDGTAAIADQSGATVLQFRWNGEFPKKRNWALRHHAFAHPWILFLDADERVNPAFVQELREILPGTTHAGFWLSFTNWFMGARLRHGDTFRKLALFRIGSGEYEQLPEVLWSSLDMEVHEHPILSGTTGHLRTRLDHQDQRDLKSYLAKHNEYSSWEARRFLWLRSAPAAAWQALTERQRFKYRHLDKWWFGWFYWLMAVLVKRGFMDGAAGLRLAHLKRCYFAEIRLKIAEVLEQRHQR